MTSNPNLAEDDTTPAKRSCLLENSWKFGPTRFAVSEKIQIIRLSETDPISNKKDAINKLVDALGNGVVNQDTGFLLQSSRSDAKKTLFRKDIDSPIVRCIYSQARDLAQKSVLIESHGDILHDNTQVQAIHIFAAGALVENRLFRVELTVRDYVETDHERKMVHSIDGVEIKEVDKNKASVWEPPAQVFPEKNSCKKPVNQPTDATLIFKKKLKKISLLNNFYTLTSALTERHILRQLTQKNTAPTVFIRVWSEESM